MELCDVNNLYSLIILLVSDEFEELTQKKKGSKQKAKSADGAIGKKSKKLELNQCLYIREILFQ